MFSTLLLAVVQSVTEFLPVSSSGHLLLLHALWGMTNESLIVDVMLHVGTLFAVLIYFRHDVIQLLCMKNMRLLFLLVVATIPAALAGLFFKEIVEVSLRSPLVVAGTSIFYGFLLWAVDRFNFDSKQINQMRYRDALAIGVAQALSLIPGTSRSGVTITAARALGFDRSESARFSMLMSLPITFLACAYVFYTGYVQRASLFLTSELIWGVLAAGMFGLIAIAILMKWVKKSTSFGFFAIYRIVLGIAIFVYFL